MQIKKTKCMIVCIAIALLAMPCIFGQIPFTEAKAPFKITMQDLGFPIDNNAGPLAINDKGEIVGTSSGHAFIWTEKQGKKDLDINAIYSSASGINNKGEVTGMFLNFTPSALVIHAFLWTEKDGAKDLGTLPDCTMSFGLVINDKTQVLGATIDQVNGRHMFLWSEETGMIEIGPLPHCTGYSGLSINNKGQIAASPHDTIDHIDISYPFTWTAKTGITELSPIFGTTDVYVYSNNDKGEFVGGYPSFARGHSDSYLYSPLTGLHDLGSPAGEAGSQALVINDKGQIVGSSWVDYSRRHAYYWDEDNGMSILESLPGTVWTDIEDINNKGQAVGICYVADANGNTVSHAVLWTISS